jgi:hypothetical protein
VGPTHHELKVVERLVELQNREETMWRQRSRIQWLSEGDHDTRFFHLKASKRKKRNRISRLVRDGRHGGSVGYGSSFYNNLYTSEGTVGMEEVLDTLLVSVMAVMNEKLIATFEEGEIKQALFQMFPLKALGPDGFSAQFFQKH